MGPTLEYRVQLALPPHEALDGLVLGQPERVVQLGGGAVPLLGALPELARVRAWDNQT